MTTCGATLDPLPDDPVQVWWDEVKDNQFWSGAIVGMEWNELWPEAQTEIEELFDKAYQKGMWVDW